MVPRKRPSLAMLGNMPRMVANLSHVNSSVSALQQWGYAANVLKPAPLLDNPLHRTDIFDGLELNLRNGTRLRLNSTMFHQHGLIGRGCVVRATCIEKEMGSSGEAWNGQLIVKLSWPAMSRMSEQVIIEQARSNADNDEHRWVLKHLPKVLHAEDVHVNLLSRALLDRLSDAYEERIWVVPMQTMFRDGFSYVFCLGTGIPYYRPNIRQSECTMLSRYLSAKGSKQ